VNLNSNIIKFVENELRISHRIIADKTDNKILSVQKLITDNISILEEFGRLRFEIESEKILKEKQKKNPNYRPEKTYFLNEQQTTLILTFMRNNEVVKQFKITLVREFYKMRELLQSQNSETQFDRELKAFNNSVEMLRVNGASKIKMLRTFHESQNLETSYLPEYSDEEHTFSAKALLEKFEIKISVQQFNKKMISVGFLETKSRKSSKYRTEKDVNGKEVKIPILKEFKSLTEKGLEFGKNMISPKNQLETQPHYFENRFEELLKILKI
jgi:phage regulator Rha-like protein